MPDWVATLLQQIINGLGIGSLYVLVALGITLVYGLTGIIVFAQGEMLMLGAFMCFITVAVTGSFWLGIVVSMASMTVLGLALERGLFRFTLDRPINGFIISLGLIMLFQHAALAIWGGKAYSMVPPFPGVWDIGPLRLSIQRVFTMVIMVGLIALFAIALKFTKPGKALRACAEDRVTARLMGIPVSRIITATFMIGAALAGAGGAAMATLFAFNPFTGGLYMMKGFAVALVGGLGSIIGAIVIGLALGVVESTAVSYFPAIWKDAFAFWLLIIVIVIRPSGLFRGAAGGELIAH